MAKKQIKTITYKYNKVPGYRTYSVDGAFGGLAPKNKIYVEFFAEKRALPRFTRHEVLENGAIGEPIGHAPDKEILREVECGIYLDINTAISLADWLNKRVAKYKELVAKLEKEGKL